MLQWGRHEPQGCPRMVGTGIFHETRPGPAPLQPGLSAFAAAEDTWQWRIEGLACTQLVPARPQDVSRPGPERGILGTARRKEEAFSCLSLSCCLAGSSLRFTTDLAIPALITFCSRSPVFPPGSALQVSACHTYSDTAFKNPGHTSYLLLFLFFNLI